jgi:hypothetical protein
LSVMDCMLYFSTGDGCLKRSGLSVMRRWTGSGPKCAESGAHGS